MSPTCLLLCACWPTRVQTHALLQGSCSRSLLHFQLAALQNSPRIHKLRCCRPGATHRRNICLLRERSCSCWPLSALLGVTSSWLIYESRLQGLGLVFVAVYQRALKLMYVDALLERVRADFSVHYNAGRFNYATFDENFRSALREAEAQADAARKPGAIQSGLQNRVRHWFLRTDGRGPVLGTVERRLSCRKPV